MMTQMRWWKALMVIPLLMVSPQSVRSQDKPEQMAQPPAAIEIIREVVAAGVSNREPVDPGQVFDPSLGRIYYFTEVHAADPPTEITHVWYYGDREMARVPLTVEGPKWRTWSSKEILPDWTGEWKVEAVSDQGIVLASQSFSLGSQPIGQSGPAVESRPVAEPAPAPAPEKQ